MKKPFALLYENKVFSVAPNTYGYESALDTIFVTREGDEYFLSDIDFHAEQHSSIYQYDPMETFLREERIRHRSTNVFNLASAKKLIVDDCIPDYKDYWSGTQENDEDMTYNRFSLSGDRHSLIKFIKECRYIDAAPELREVALHDDSERLRHAAVNALFLLGKKVADPIINEVLSGTNDRFMIINTAISLRAFTTGEMHTTVLRKKFEEHYHDFTERALSVKYYKTVPQAIILACGHIPSIEALEILEEGLRHPFAYVERGARLSILIWLATVAQSGTKDAKLIKRAVEAQRRYDPTILYGEGWDTFKKLPGAEFRF